MIIIIVLDDFFYDFSILSNTPNFELVSKVSKSISSYNYCWIGLVCWRCGFSTNWMNHDKVSALLVGRQLEAQFSVALCFRIRFLRLAACSALDYSHLIFTHRRSVVDLDQQMFILLTDNIRKIIIDQERKLNNELVKHLIFFILLLVVQLGLLSNARCIMINLLKPFGWPKYSLHVFALCSRPCVLETLLFISGAQRWDDWTLLDSGCCFLHKFHSIPLGMFKAWCNLNKRAVSC